MKDRQHESITVMPIDHTPQMITESTLSQLGVTPPIPYIDTRSIISSQTFPCSTKTHDTFQIDGKPELIRLRLVQQKSIQEHRFCFQQPENLNQNFRENVNQIKYHLAQHAHFKLPDDSTPRAALLVLCEETQSIHWLSIGSQRSINIFLRNDSLQISLPMRPCILEKIQDTTSVFAIFQSLIKFNAVQKLWLEQGLPGLVIQEAIVFQPVHHFNITTEYLP